MENTAFKMKAIFKHTPKNSQTKLREGSNDVGVYLT